VARRPRSDAPACPRHPGSHVVFDGRYGSPGHKRQRFRCYPGGPGAPKAPYHRFVEALPRQLIAGGICESCEQEVPAHHGPPGARRYNFSARQVAAALMRVGSGSSYRMAAYTARRDAQRFPVRANGRVRLTDHGQLVADWVEVFAPVVFEPHRRFEWPTTGSIVLDHLPLRVRTLNAHGRPKPGGAVAFDVFAAMGYDNDRPVFVRLEAFPDASAANWVAFLGGGGLTGQPARVVTDGHDGTINAARLVWPEARMYRSEWHLMRSVEKKLIAAKVHGDATLMAQFRQAFVSRYWWEHFRVKVHRLKLPAVDRQLDVVEPVIAECWRTRPELDDRRVNPITSGGLERRMEPIGRWLEPRAHLLTNKRRLDRLLMLMQLHLDGFANHAAYTRAIRDWLSSRDGIAIGRRGLADRADALSLHDGIRPKP
jgi:hypothetical protein